MKPTIMETSVTEKLKQYVSNELLNNRVAVEADDDLLGDGMVDSLGMMWLIAFIEKDFGVKVPPADLTIEHFRTIEAIESYLSSRLG